MLARLRSTAALEYRELAQLIAQAARRNPPGDVEDAMRRNAGTIESGRLAEAAREARDVAARLEALAHDLESARRAAVQPQLERLLATEKQAAELLERLRSNENASNRREALKGLSDLADAVDQLATSDGPLRNAAHALHTAMQSSNTGVLPPIDKIKFGAGGVKSAQPGFNNSLTAVVLALQAKIQEIIFDDELADRDSPVPPRYKEMVDDYYRILSQDLR